MASSSDSTPKGEPSTIPAVLPFPQRNKGRIRKSQSIAGSGELMLDVMAIRGEPVPPNVERLSPLPEPTPIVRSPELLLAIAIWTTIPKAKQARALSQLRYIGSASRCPHALAVSALLDREG